MQGGPNFEEREPLVVELAGAQARASVFVATEAYSSGRIQRETQPRPPVTEPEIDVYDFFSGCGGTSLGLQNAGLSPRIAIDFDELALETYTRNIPDAAALIEDITKLSTSSVERYFTKDRVRPILICACAPCQPFSSQNRHKKADDGRLTLLGHLRRFVERFRPELMLIENVPGINGSKRGVQSPLDNLLGMLDELGYEYDVRILAAHDYGVPQARRRLLVAASLFGPISLPEPTHGDGKLPHVTVREAIGHLPNVEAGASHPAVPHHQAATLSPTNLRRIRSSKPGGTWNDWPEELRLRCHASVNGYTDVYGRLDWDRPAPALTTNCTSYSNGRYGHPEQDRAITVLEAALLQTFDAGFSFAGSPKKAARQIGNAVPVRLAEAIGQMFKRHVLLHQGNTLG